MDESFPDLSDFLNQPRPITDGAVLRQYRDFGLESDDPLAIVRPFAELLFGRNQVAEAIGLILGRNVTSNEILGSRFLSDVASTGFEDPGFAFTSLVLAMRDTPEKIEAPRPDAQ